MTPENERDTAAAGDEAHRDEAGRESAVSDADAAHAAARAAGANGAADGGVGQADEAVGDPGGEARGAAAGEAPTDGADQASDEAVGAEPAEEESPEQRLAAAEALAAAHWDRLVRLQAEMENQRKRAQRDVGNARKFALEAIAQDLLPVKDSLELGLAAARAGEADVASLREGSELTLKMLAQVLEKHAIVEIDPEGERFDPEFHQAMSMQEVDGVAPNTVTGVMQKGYTLNDRLIRPALVMVSK